MTYPLPFLFKSKSEKSAPKPLCGAREHDAKSLGLAWLLSKGALLRPEEKLACLRAQQLQILAYSDCFVANVVRNALHRLMLI